MPTKRSKKVKEVFLLIDPCWPEDCLSFVTILTLGREGFLWCRHKSRRTWEWPGGKREEGETLLQTARRELLEETGQTADFHRLCDYALWDDEACSGGRAFIALNLRGQGALNHEIAELKEAPPLAAADLTYPLIHTNLLAYARLARPDLLER